MKKYSMPLFSFWVLLATLASSLVAHAQDTNCPTDAWGGGGDGQSCFCTLGGFISPTSLFPTNDTAGTNGTGINVPDCMFHQWSWEAFVWATTPDTNGILRFMNLPTTSDLLTTSAGVRKPQKRPLRLGLRSHKEPGSAIVEADGNMLVASNGYPVYASVHMNESYFNTAQSNMIYNGGYTNNVGNDNYFNVGAAVFKATWLRVDSTNEVPSGAYTTKALVPILSWSTNGGTNLVFASNKTTNVLVALLGLHVVGYTTNHPEFLWGTFEHKLNAPALPDNTFTTNGVNTNNFTLYKANTSYSVVNQQNENSPFPLSYDAKTGKFSPRTQAVLLNATGGENNSPEGPENIAAINQAAHEFLAILKAPQSTFTNYNLIGTVWLQPNTYVANITNNAALMTNGTGLSSIAKGSVNLANSTAETFQQVASNSNTNTIQNCFLCHNPSSYTFNNPLPLRRIALSHVLSTGTNAAMYGVPNLIQVNKITNIPRSGY